MPLYLSPYTGLGTKADPFRAVGSDQPGSSAVDIRLDATRADGNGIPFALLWLPAGSTDPLGSIKLANDYGDLLTKPQRNRLNNALGLDFGADVTIQDAISTIMLRPNTLSWKRLRPAKGIYELWLGSGSGKRDWMGLPVIAGGSISDNFNRANETPIAAPWTELSGSTGDMNLSTNAIMHSAAGDLYLYYNNSGGWNADQSSQWNYTSAVTDHDWGPAVRIGSGGAFSGYFYSLVSLAAFAGVSKHVAGSYSIIESGYAIGATGSTFKIDVTGSTIRCYKAGVEDALSPATDTSLSVAGNGAGLFMYNTGGSVDDFLATGEISGSSASLVFPRHPLAALLVR